METMLLTQKAYLNIKTSIFGYGTIVVLNPLETDNKFHYSFIHYPHKYYQ